MNLKYHHNINNDLSSILDSYYIFGDLNKIKQVLRNVISNAFKFTSKTYEINHNGIVSCTFIPYNDQQQQYQESSNTIRTNNFFNKKEDKYLPSFISNQNFDYKGDQKDNKLQDNSNIFNRLKIIITDNGPGISSIDQDKLFKSVVQFKPGVLQSGGGSGLGLLSKFMLIYIIIVNIESEYFHYIIYLSEF